MSGHDALSRAFGTHRRLLLGIAYRMLGSTRDAEDVVQDTFARLLASPPRDLDELRPLLVTVATNLARDLLRRRRFEGYAGTWLPAPFAAGGDEDLELEPSVEARYSVVESASIAFLLALEALTPTARAVTILRDVLDYSVTETAAALGVTEAKVKTTHHRARATLASYDATRVAFDADRAARSRLALEAFLLALMSGDVARVETVLARDVVAVSDAGEFRAARRTLVGAARVAKVQLALATKYPTPSRFEIRILNGLATLVAERDEVDDGIAPRFTLTCDVDRNGKIVAIHTILATKKLDRVAFVVAAAS